MRLALAVLALAALSACASASAGDHRYVDRAGWSLSYPSGMNLERSGARLRITVSEVTVASFRQRRAVHSGRSWIRTDPPRDLHGSLPADGVAFRIATLEGGPGPDLALPESRFPIRLRSFRRSNAYRGLPRPLERIVVADGRSYDAFVWIGPKASRQRRAELARVVASLSFPRLRSGQRAGDFAVLGPVTRYPVGSFTRVRASGAPFWLVHAPGGFYAIGWSWETLSGGYKSRCRLRLDARRKQFFCTNLHARWDRVGRVLAKPPGASRGDPLNLATVKPSWDGHVLLAAGTATFADQRLAHRLWPSRR